MAIIEVKGLKKNYGELEVLKSIDLEIEEGQVVLYYRSFWIR